MLRPTFLPTEATTVATFSPRSQIVSAEREREWIEDSRSFRNFDREMRHNRGTL